MADAIESVGRLYFLVNHKVHCEQDTHKRELDVEIKAVNWMAWVGVRWKGKGRWRVGCYLSLAEVRGVSLALGATVTCSPNRHLHEVVDSRADLEGRR